MVLFQFFQEDVEQREGLLNHIADKFPELLRYCTASIKETKPFLIWTSLPTKEMIAFMKKWKV